MTTSVRIKAILAVCHLVLVACGAARYVPVPVGGNAAKAIGIYGEYSGSTSGYGFFAPGVASAWDAQFSLYAEDRPGWTEAADWGANREVQLRLTTVLGAFADEDRRETLAGSWAAAQFARHPDARLINVHIRAYDLPTMAEYRRGHRPEWVTVAVFPFAYHLDEPEQE